MPRSSNAARMASDAIGDGGIGVPSGMTTSISELSRNPRAERNSCISSAVSLGAGGHLKGVLVTATMTRPATEGGQHLAQCEGALDRVELVAASSSPGVASGCRSAPRATTRMSASKAPASVSTWRVVGSIAVTGGSDEPHARLDDVGVAVHDPLGRHATEHHVQFGEPEHEAVGLVDEGDLGRVAAGLGHLGRHF